MIIGNPYVVNNAVLQMILVIHDTIWRRLIAQYNWLLSSHDTQDQIYSLSLIAI